MAEILKVILVGDTCAKKWKIINRFCEKERKEILISLGSDFSSRTLEYKDFGRTIKFELWAPFERDSRTILSHLIKNFQVIIFCL